jgi:hypothetical protein
MKRKTDVVTMLRQLAAPAPAKQETPALTRYEVELELRRHHQAFEEQREEQRRAEEAAQRPPLSAVETIRAALAGNPAPAQPTVALNSADILRAALAGGAGTINGQSGRGD